MSNFDAEDLVLHLSDLHIGEIVDLPVNKFNPRVARKRLTYFFEKVKRIVKDLYKTAVPIETMHVFLTGDMIHNETMRGSAKMATNMDFTEQIELAASTLADGLSFLVSELELQKAHVYGVRGNHGRVGKPGEESPTANLDYQVYYILSLLLHDRHGDLFTCEFTKSPYVTARVQGWNWVAEHLDTVKSYAGIPYYGLARRRDLLYKQLHGKLDVLLGGHFHRSFVEHDGAIHTILCASLVGLNQYAMSIGAGNVAQQNMYLVSKKHGITSMRCINLAHIQN